MHERLLYVEFIIIIFPKVHNIKIYIIASLSLYIANSTLATWRAATFQWVNNLKIWLEHIRSIDNTFTQHNLDALLTNISKLYRYTKVLYFLCFFQIDDDSRVNDVHTGIRTVWLEIFNEFNSKKRCY